MITRYTNESYKILYVLCSMFQFEFDLKIDGTFYWKVPNTRAEAFSGVKIYRGSPFVAPALNGKMRNFQVQTN